MSNLDKKAINKKIADEYRKSINENCIDFSNLDEAKEYLKTRGFRYQETYSVKANKHIIYRKTKGRKSAMIKTNYKFLNDYSMDKWFVYEVSVW
jgi:hypothetical protein|tara:strand:+ start:957 stop:1238 length:282 start_codon:yes stop_codon:yes gene_type:complete